MKKGKIDWDALKNVDIYDVCERYGIEVQRDSILCPEHDDRNFGSCHLYKNHYKCFACGASGDAIDLVSHTLCISRVEAALKLSDDFCVPFLDTEYVHKNPDDVMPFTVDQLKSLGLYPDKCDPLYIINDYCDIKLDGMISCPDDMDFGYIHGTRLTISIVDLWNETGIASGDPASRQLFYQLVYGKLCEQVQRFCHMYNTEFYMKFGRKSAPFLQEVIEMELTNLTQICVWFERHSQIKEQAKESLLDFYYSFAIGDLYLNHPDCLLVKDVVEQGPENILKATKRKPKIKRYVMKA